MRRLVATGSVVLIAIVTLGACGGSEDESPSSSDRNPLNTAPDGSSSDSDFSKLYADMTKQKFKITFVNDDGEESTYAQDGNGKSVFGTGDTQYFTSSSGSVSCTTSSGGKAECATVPAGVATSGFLRIYAGGRSLVGALSRYGDSSTDTIAGRDAECETFSAETIADKAPPGLSAIIGAIKGSAAYCIDKETGVLLRFSSADESGKDRTEFEVTKFEEPADSEFEPPAEPSTPSSISLPPGYTVPTIPGPD